MPWFINTINFTSFLIHPFPSFVSVPSPDLIRLAAQQTQFEQMNADRVEEETQLGNAAQALNDQVLALRENLKSIANKLAGVTGGGDGKNLCPAGGCTPTILADGSDLTLSAASGDVKIESEQCGSVSVCAMSQSVSALAIAIANLGEL
jgi:hypothetical protein